MNCHIRLTDVHTFIRTDGQTDKSLEVASGIKQIIQPSFLGDIFVDIASRESKIILSLAEIILEEAVGLEAGIGLVAQLDCLLAFAIVGSEKNWTRPELALDGPLGRAFREFTNHIFVFRLFLRRKASS